MSRAGAARLIVLAGIWGASFLFIKVGLQGLSPLQIATARLVAGAVVLLAILAVRRQPLPRSAAVWGHLVAMGLVANVVPFFLFGWAEQRIASGTAGVLNGTTPLFTLAIAAAALPEERWSAARAGGLALGFVGVLVVVGPDGLGAAAAASAGGGAVAGQAAVLLAACCYGIAFVYTRRFLAGRGHGPLSLAAGQLSAAAGVLLLVVPVAAWTPVRLTAEVTGAVLALGVFGTGLAYLLYYRLIADEGATTASLVTYLIPIAAVLLGTVVLDEPLRWTTFVGAAVVLCGIAVAEGRLRRSPPAVAGGDAAPARTR